MMDQFQEKKKKRHAETISKSRRTVSKNRPSKPNPLTCDDPLGLIGFHVAIVLTGNWSEIGFWPVIQSRIKRVRVICVTSQRSRW